MTKFIRGTCSDMCPPRERAMREREGLLHLLELSPGTPMRPLPKADPLLTVKSFSRSAAGQHAPRPEDLRPLHVLQKTVVHLLSSPLVQRENLDWCVVYDFVFDRLRAVRQDLVVQGFDSRDCIRILEPIVLFHCYAGYRLCEEPVAKFDHTINHTHLRECLKRLLVLYDETDEIGDGRGDMEALYLLMGIGDAETLTRYLYLSPQIRKHPSLKTAFAMSQAFWCGNYVRVCKLLKTLPPLLMCAAAQRLPAVRRHALIVMSNAFSSRNLTFPLERLTSILLYKSEKQAALDCERCGINVRDGAVSFNKTAFKIDAKIACTKVACIDKALESLRLTQLLRLPSDPNSR